MFTDVLFGVVAVPSVIQPIAGGNSLPALRGSLIESGRAEGRIVARTHPRIEPGSLAGLLTAAGFAMPVVDVDRVRLRYEDLEALIRDLRAMAATAVQRWPLRAGPRRLWKFSISSPGRNNRGKRRVNLVPPIKS